MSVASPLVCMYVRDGVRTVSYRVLTSGYLFLVALYYRPTTLVQSIHRNTVASPKAAGDHIRLLERAYGRPHTTHTHTHMHRHTQTHTYIYTYTNTHTHTHTHTDIHIYAHTHIHKHTNTQCPFFVFISICAYLCRSVSLSRASWVAS